MNELLNAQMRQGRSDQHRCADASCCFLLGRRSSLHPPCDVCWMRQQTATRKVRTRCHQRRSSKCKLRAAVACGGGCMRRAPPRALLSQLLLLPALLLGADVHTSTSTAAGMVELGPQGAGYELRVQGKPYYVRHVVWININININIYLFQCFHSI